ncbi:MAG: DUF2177 family protein [Planctomycetia bacterium]|nr:DUF2177 family protein [Planctomycetia bacterium]
MKMIYYLKLYAVTLLVFLAIDMVWLGVIAKGMYQKHLGYLMAPEINWWAAFAFYSLFIVGLLVFVVSPGLEEKSLFAVIWKAALFGLVTYATYDLTNQATVKNWPMLVTIIDLIWGALLSTIVSVISYFAGMWLKS